MKRALIIGLLFLAFVPKVWGQDHINVLAQSIKRYPLDHLVVARGNVEIVYQDVRLLAEKVSLYTDTKDLVAEGDTTLYQGKDYLKCDRLEFNLRTKTGVAYRAKGLFHPFYHVEGDRIKKVSEKRYVIENGSFTTCPVGKVCKNVPSWSFKAKKMTIDAGGYARGGPVSFWIKKIPVLALPYIKVPVYKERKTGFLVPRPGYESNKGFFLSVPFFWAISESQDATLTLTPYSKQGLRGSLEYRYVIDKKSRGYFLGDYMNRRNPNRKKWSLYFEHKQWIQDEWRILAKMDIRSDERYARTYIDDVSRRVERYTDSYVTLTRNWHSTHFYLAFRGKKDMVKDYGESTYKLPEFRLSFTPAPIFDTPLYLEADNEFLRYQRKSSTLKLSTQLLRVDLHPQLSLPVRLKPWLSVTPKVGIRDTWYSKSREDDGNIRGDTYNRVLPNLGLALRGPQLERVFPVKKDKVLKHTIIPEIQYTYVPKKKQSDIPYFDFTDYIHPQDTFLFSVTNWLYMYTPKKAKRLAKVRIAQGYHAHFHKEAVSPLGVGSTGRPFTDLLVDVDTNILPGISLDTQVKHSVYGEGITSWDTQIYARKSKFHFKGSYHYQKKPEERFAIAEPGVKLGAWDFSSALRYDLKYHHPRERELKAVYEAACWSLTADYLNVDNRHSGAANEKKIYFYVTLKGIGTVGRGK